MKSIKWNQIKKMKMFVLLECVKVILFLEKNGCDRKS